MRGGLIRGVTQVLRKRSAYLRGAYTRGRLYAGVGGLIGGKIRYTANHKILRPSAKIDLFLDPS